MSRNPLSADDIKALIGTAITLHAKALEEKRDQRWWIPPLGGLAGALIGAVAAIIGGFLKNMT